MHVAEDAVDVRLNWTSSGAGGAIINPSLLFTGDGKLVRTARELARVHTTVSDTLCRPSVAVTVTALQAGRTRQVQEGEQLSVTEEIFEWKSSIVVSEAPMGAAAVGMLGFAKELHGDGAPLLGANLTANLRERGHRGVGNRLRSASIRASSILATILCQQRKCSGLKTRNCFRTRPARGHTASRP